MSENGQLELIRTASYLTVKWVVQKWTELKSLEKGQSVTSPPFDFKGQSWYLNLCPNGYDAVKAGYISVFLYLGFKSVTIPLTIHWTFFIGNQVYLSGESTLAHEFGTKAVDWGYRDFISHRQLEKEFVNENNEFIVGIKMEDKLSITLESFFEPFVQKLYKNSKESGDVTIMCNDNKIVRADRNVLVQDPFFISLFAFKGAQLESPSLSESNTNSSLAVKPGDTSMIDLETFSNESVSHLVEFLYTGSTYVPASIEARCELLFLADYTTNQNLCHLLGRKIEMIDFTPSAIMDVLILTRNRGNLLEFRQSAIDYYRKNKKQIVNCPGYQEKYNIFVDEHLDVDMLKDLIR